MALQNKSLAFLLINSYEKPTPVHPSLAKKYHILNLLCDISRTCNIEGIEHETDVKRILESLGEDTAPFQH